jgi:hypothetical protein
VSRLSARTPATAAQPRCRARFAKCQKMEANPVCPTASTSKPTSTAGATKGFADRATTIEDLIDGQYRAPARVVAFNTAEGWSRDVSEEIADELRTRINRAYVDVPSSLEDFLDRYAGDRPLQLPLPLRDAA